MVNNFIHTLQPPTSRRTGVYRPQHEHRLQAIEHENVTSGLFIFKENPR